MEIWEKIKLINLRKPKTQKKTLILEQLYIYSFETRRKPSPKYWSTVCAFSRFRRFSTFLLILPSFPVFPSVSLKIFNSGHREKHCWGKYIMQFIQIWRWIVEDIFLKQVLTQGGKPRSNADVRSCLSVSAELESVSEDDALVFEIKWIEKLLSG